ncbi:MAG TPA: rhodanese-like domain-containing protein [Terriglobales bacterium]|jgi:rhodanese-related sulfurtransferase
MPDIEITPAELHQRLSAGEPLRLLDVREPWEFEQASLATAENIPLNQIPMHLEAMAASDANAEIICFCHSGRRSLTAADWLRRSGVPGARSLAGGIDQWSRDIDPSIPRY